MNKRKELAPQISTKDELRLRQDQFATILNVDPEKIRGLKFCHVCHGIDYQWTDWSRTPMDLPDLDFTTSEQVKNYREYLTDICCRSCDGTGFEGGNCSLSIEEWLNLGKRGH